MELKECINFQLTKAQQMVFQKFKSGLLEYDVTPVQSGVLKCLWLQDGQTPGQIANSLCLDSSTITGILDRMESKGLVRRTADPNDRRALRVVLTKQGKLLEQPVKKAIEELNKKVLGVLTKEEQINLMNYLERVYSA